MYGSWCVSERALPKIWTPSQDSFQTIDDYSILPLFTLLVTNWMTCLTSDTTSHGDLLLVMRSVVGFKIYNDQSWVTTTGRAIMHSRSWLILIQSRMIPLLVPYYVRTIPKLSQSRIVLSGRRKPLRLAFSRKKSPTDIRLQNHVIMCDCGLNKLAVIIIIFLFKNIHIYI